MLLCVLITAPSLVTSSSGRETAFNCEESLCVSASLVTVLVLPTPLEIVPLLNSFYFLSWDKHVFCLNLNQDKWQVHIFNDRSQVTPIYHLIYFTSFSLFLNYCQIFFSNSCSVFNHLQVTHRNNRTQIFSFCIKYIKVNILLYM